MYARMTWLIALFHQQKLNLLWSLMRSDMESQQHPCFFSQYQLHCNVSLHNFALDKYQGRSGLTYGKVCMSSGNASYSISCEVTAGLTERQTERCRGPQRRLYLLVLLLKDAVGLLMFIFSYTLDESSFVILYQHTEKDTIIH